MEAPSEFFRKIEVLYLLSQGSEQADHPHMIQVQYPSHQQAPTLRDVKSRLTALRGRGMPDSYSWSYKRSYKGAFIWCDVFDDDIILPLSHSGEYVLKALEVFDASQDNLDQEADRHFQSLVQSVTREEPKKVHEATVSTAKQELPQLDAIHINGHVRNAASIDFSKQQSMGGLTHNGIATKACGSERSDDYSTDARSISVSEDFIENKRCLEKSKGSEFSTSVSVTNSNAGYQAEPCDISDENSDVSSFERVPKTETKELPSGPVMRSTDNGETSSLPFASSGFSRKEPVKSRTWIVKEEDNPAASSDGRTSRRHSDEFYERESMLRRRDIPSSPVARPCFPGDPFMFMLKKAVRFHRSQLCRKVEVVERFRALPVEEPSFSRYSSTARHGIRSKNVSHKPHFSNIVTLKSKPQRNRISSEEPERESRSLSVFLETAKIRSSSQRTDDGASRKTGSARHIRSVSNVDAYGTARCREVVVVPEAVLPPERLPREDEKAMSDLKSKKPLVKPDMKSFKVVTKSAVRHSSKPGAEPSSSLFNPASAHSLQLPTCTVSRPKEITKERILKHQRSLVAEFVDIPRDETSIAGEDSTVTTQLDLKTHRVPRNVSKNCYFSLPVPGAEKRTSDTKVYPSRESSVFDSAALHSDNMQEVKMVNSKLKVQAAPVTETSFPNGESTRPKDSASNHKSYKAREERPLTPGLTEMRWESLLQKAVVQDQPPKDLVLHECFQCGRTFKPESLKVHLRGCHIINKPKPSPVFRKRVSL
ncbi:hypothetical protein M758_9G001700 [Ceratodon purpureus]|nr:hypothetical protein M758_9G001700 [Ceratodon purpureus]